MGVFSHREEDGFEQVIFCEDRSCGLRLIIAIHNTVLGPALGGCRMWPYATEEEAVQDALRLAKGMTYKSAVAGLDYGGGKAVIWGDPKKDKSEALFRALGRFVDTLKGRFITGTDVGTYPEDFVYAARETKYVTSLPVEYGGSGNSAVPTAKGVMHGLHACMQHRYGRESLQGVRVAVQGLGKVGSVLVEMLLAEGAQVVATDVDDEKVRRVQARHPEVQMTGPEEIYDIDCEVFSPNALGAVLNDQTIPRLRCNIVAGSANNQLAEARHGDELHRRGILYAPDYVINAGGVIQVADELQGLNPQRVEHRVQGIYGTLQEIFRLAEQEGLPTYVAADRWAERRIESVAEIHRVYA